VDAERILSCGNDVRLIPVCGDPAHETKCQKFGLFVGTGVCIPVLEAIRDVHTKVLLVGRVDASEPFLMMMMMMMMILLLFLQKQNLAFAVYQFGSVLSLPD